MHEFEFWDTGMFKVITVEREYGAGGSLVAAELARHKGMAIFGQTAHLRDRETGGGR